MSSSDEESYRETASKNDTPRGTCWICQEKTKNPNAKQHKGCRQEQNLANKKRKKKLRKEKKKKKEKALKARKKLAKQKEQAKAKKRKRSNKDTGETGKPSKKSKSKSTKANTNTHTNTATTTTTTTTTSKNKNKNININKIEQPGGESKEDAIAPSPAVFVEDIENATVFKVERYNRVSSPDLQVKDGLEWRYVSIHVHKKDAHVVIWYGGVEYEGLGLKKGRRYTLLGLPEEDMFTGDNAQLLDGDGDSIEARRGPPKPLPTFQVHLYNQVSAERFQVEGAGPGEFRSCTLWELKVKENQHCVIFYGGIEYEGLGANYTLNDLKPSSSMFDGTNGCLRDGDGEEIHCRVESIVGQLSAGAEEPSVVGSSIVTNATSDSIPGVNPPNMQSQVAELCIPPPAPAASELLPVVPPQIVTQVPVLPGPTAEELLVSQSLASLSPQNSTQAEPEPTEPSAPPTFYGAPPMDD